MKVFNVHYLQKVDLNRINTKQDVNAASLKVWSIQLLLYEAL